VHEDYRVTVALLSNEAAHATGLELTAGRSMHLYRLLHGASHKWIIALCGFATHCGLGPLLHWHGKPL
jgi:hypothetical protein